jgi:hypothetical protein
MTEKSPDRAPERHVLRPRGPRPAGERPRCADGGQSAGLGPASARAWTALPTEHETARCWHSKAFRTADPDADLAPILPGESPKSSLLAPALVAQVNRSGPKSEVSLSTDVGQGAVWRTSMPAFRAELSIAKQSAPVHTASLTR